MSSFAEQLLAVAEDVTPKLLAIPKLPKGLVVREVESVYLGGFKFGERELARYTT